MGQQDQDGVVIETSINERLSGYARSEVCPQRVLRWPVVSIRTSYAVGCRNGVMVISSIL
jgi:hypothetical protein